MLKIRSWDGSDEAAKVAAETADFGRLRADTFCRFINEASNHLSVESKQTSGTDPKKADSTGERSALSSPPIHCQARTLTQKFRRSLPLPQHPTY